MPQEIKNPHHQCEGAFCYSMLSPLDDILRAETTS